MNKLLLFLIMLPKGIWKAMGADTVQLKAILLVKLKTDDRKPLTFGAQNAKKKSKATSVLTVFISFLIGLIYIFPLITFDDRLLALTVFYSLLLFMMTFLLITDFSNVMFDSKEKYILLPRPVSDITLIISRFLHIAIYLFRLVIPLALPGWIIWGMLTGWVGAIWFAIPLTLLVFIMLFMVIGVYLLIMRISGPEKFKDILNYFQIFASILFFASAYFIPQMANAEMLPTLKSLQFEWLVYVPTYWLAACWTWVSRPDLMIPGTPWLSILAIVFPLLCLWVTVKFFAPTFIRTISAMDNVQPETERKATKRKSSKGDRYLRLANKLNKSDAAKAGFIITWLQTQRSRAFRMRVYPTFAYVPIYFVFLMLQSNRPFSEVWAELPDSNRHILLLYLCAFTLMYAITYLTMSDQYKAAWVYYASPVEEPGNVMGGAFKALWVKYFLPFFLAVALMVVYIWGLKDPINIFLDIVLACVNVTLFTVCMLRIAYRYFPFSIKEQMNNAGGRVIKVIAGMLIPTTMGIGHWLITASGYLWLQIPLKLVFLLLSSILLWMIWDSYFKTSWKQLHALEAET